MRLHAAFCLCGSLYPAVHKPRNHLETRSAGVRQSTIFEISRRRGSILSARAEAQPIATRVAVSREDRTIRASTTHTVRAWLLRHISRETSSGRFIPEMDGLRFVAIAMVVLFHLNGYLMAKAPFYEHGLAGPDWLCRSAMVGFHGVELLFLISGFILAMPFAAHYLAEGPAVNLRKYFLRRLTRLEPPYFVTIFLLIFLTVVMRQGPQLALFSHLAASLAYVHNLIYGAPSTVIGVAWSLEIEVQFYLLVPLLTLVFAIRSALWRRSLLAGAVFLTVASQSVFLQHHPRCALSILGYLQFFLIGFLLADLFLASSLRRNFYWDLIAFGGWPLLLLLLQSRLLTLWLFPWALLVLYCAAFRGRCVNHIFRNPWLTAVGGMCYSIYLIHYEVISAVARFTKPLGRGLPNPLYLLAQFALVGTPIVLICTIYFLLLEKPCMKRDWPQRLWQHSSNKFLLLRNLNSEKVLRSGLSRP